MIKKTIYPKTKRISCSEERIEITEKLDGSNLCIFKLDGYLYIAQRKTILREDELETNKDKLYKGFYTWFNDHKEELNLIHEESVVCGEWLGMGRLKYLSQDGFDKRFYMFAKANIDNNFELYNLNYTHEFFIYPFEDQKIPNCIGIVPIVATPTIIPSKNELDIMYSTYCQNVDRNVEGFVINYNNYIQKYVRMKNGKLSEHFDRE